MPKVSVVIAAYNCSPFILQSIESVLAQKYPFLEIIIVNDGSTDATAKRLEAYRRHPLIKLFHQAQRGQGWTKNRLIRTARGKYIALFDADDIMLPGRLQKQADTLDNSPLFGACYGKGKIVDMHLRPIKDELYGNEFGKPIEKNWDLLQTLMLPGTLMFRRSIAEKIGGYNAELDYSADTDFMLRLAEHTRLLFLNEPLILYRRHKDSASHKEAMRREELIARRMAIARRYGVDAQFLKVKRCSNLNLI